MKKIYLLGVIATAMVFTACSIEKRHYRNGYHVTWNHNAPHAAQQTNSTPENTTVAVTEVTPEAVTVTEATPAVVEQVATPAQKAQPAAGKVNEQVAQPNVLPALRENTVRSQAKHIIKQKPLTADAPVSAPETDKVLLVILAILIPPLAMYLYEGSWTKRCTVNLILTLLCGLPGMIHALVVILGGK